MVHASHACMPNERVARDDIFSFRKDLLCHLCVYNGSVSSLTLARWKKDTLVIKIRVEGQVKVQRVFFVPYFPIKGFEERINVADFVSIKAMLFNT